MLRNNSQSWIPIFACILLTGIGLFISVCLVLSLIPLYLTNHAVEKSDTTYPVYTLANVPFTIGSGTGRQIRATDSASLEPAQAMISSFGEQLTKLLSEIDAGVVVTELTIPSATELICTLKIFLRRGCFACQKADKKSIREKLKKGLTLSIYKEYYQGCSLNAITSGITDITLDDDIDDDKISRPKPTLIKTLVQQPDVCGGGQTPPLVYPTDCIRTEPTGTVTTLTVTNEETSYTPYCFYIVTSTSDSKIKVEFIFSSTDGTISVDDITLNSTVNLITNGDFQTIYYEGTGKDRIMIPGPAWTVSNCGQDCRAELSDFRGRSETSGFYTRGSVNTLSTTVAINTVGQQFIYRLGFWIQFECFGETCSAMVKLTTT